jgi:hypothetical protein
VNSLQAPSAPFRSKLIKGSAGASLVIGIAASLTGCGTGTSGVSLGANASSSPSATAAAYGSVNGSGVRVETPTGSYEKIVADKTGPSYNPDYGLGYPFPDYLSSAGWTEQDAVAGQRFVVDYLVQEYLDSTALEGGDEAFQKWYETDAKRYFPEELYAELSANGSANGAVLGNFAGQKLLPNSLIHDSKPRISSIDLDISSTNNGPFDDGQGLKGIKFSIGYTAQYRVDDANAAELAGVLTGMSGEEVINSDLAKDKLKDGTGENSHQAKGTANFVVTKDANGEWKIIGYSSQPNFDTGDYTTR